MAYQLENKLVVAIEYEYQEQQLAEIPLDTNTVLQELCMVESTRNLMPTLFVHINDGLKFFERYPLQDGRQIRVSLIAEGQVLAQTGFRIFSFSSNFNGSTTEYKIDAYLDNPLYWWGTQCMTYNGTSSYVVQQVGRQCGLQVEADETHDPQLWCQGNMTNSQFIAYLTKHSFRTNNSYMVSGLRLDNTLLFKDVQPLVSPMFNVVAYSQQDGYYTTTDYNIKSNSGLNNLTGGYAYTLVAQSLNTDTTLSQVMVKTTTRTVNTNSNVKTMIKRSAVKHSFIRPDLAPNFWLGTYQNDRIAKLYNVDVSMIINIPTQLSILNTFSLSALTTDSDVDLSESGLYIVDTRCIYIRGTQYCERINACRQGMN